MRKAPAVIQPRAANGTALEPQGFVPDTADMGEEHAFVSSVEPFLPNLPRKLSMTGWRH
jgi:hypothetical protein